MWFFRQDGEAEGSDSEELVTLTEHIDRLYQSATGLIEPAAFWGYSLAEVRGIIDQNNKQKTDELKTQINLYDFLAIRFAELMRTEGEIIPLNEYFPKLFDEEEIEKSQEQKEMELEINKINMMAFMEHHNKKRGEISAN